MGLVLSVINQKGGVGKTSSASNLGMSLAEKTFKVLLMDADPQCDLTTSLGVFDQGYAIHDFLNNEPLRDEDRVEVAENLYLIRGYHDLMELKLTKPTFRTPISKVVQDYDFIIIDCQPQRVVQSRLILNECILNATDHVLLPLDVNYNSVKGTLDFIESLHRIKATYNHALKIMGIFFTKVNDRETSFSTFRSYLLEQNAGLVFETHIRRDVSVKKAQEVGKPLALFNDRSNACADYRALADEVIKRAEAKEQS